MSKKYGLIYPNENESSTSLKPKLSCFNESSSDSDSETNLKKLKSEPSQPKYKDLAAQQKLLEEDPTIYQYDELYDEIQEKKIESKLARKDVERKPKYINNIIKTAERRKLENELRIERQVQKERALEGEMFKDKEQFVTSSYKKKLEELRKIKEQQLREDYLEEIGDVAKQSDLSGFYRHLYEQQVKNIDPVNEIKENEQKPQEKDSEYKMKENIKTKKIVDKQKFRKKQTSDNEEDEKTNDLDIKPNLDADSDFSIDSSSDSESENNKKLEKMENVQINDDIKENTNNENQIDKPLEFEPEIVEENKNLNQDNVIVEEKRKEKIDIWKKRTVGDVYDEALKRYYERKAEREANQT